MKQAKIRKYINFGGIDKLLNSKVGDANEIINCRESRTGGWKANVGVESWWKFPATFISNSRTTQYFDSPVDSVYQWKRAGSSDVYTFIEQAGMLYYVLGNKGQRTTYAASTYVQDVTIIEEGRYVRKLSEVGTQYINLGSKLLIINGKDRAILFSGDKIWRDFGFTQAAGMPYAIPVDPAYQQGVKLDGGTSIWFDDTTEMGLGLANTSKNNYGWKVSYISDTGSESPLSPIEYSGWQIPVTAPQIGLYRYAVFLEIPTGPDGTKARRIYRTKNIPTNGEQYFFVKQITENSSRLYVDYISDQFLINTAPEDLDSVTVPTDFEYGDVWDGRLWLARGTRLMYSERGKFEQFSGLNFFDTSNTDGGDITQVISYYNNLIVMRETAINVISTNNAGYSISTINNSIGTTASNSVILIPEVGVCFMNNDGIWSMKGGLDGGAWIAIAKVSHGIDKLLDGRNNAMNTRITAAYSSIEKAAWWHYADTDSTVPNAGVWMNLQGKDPKWSQIKAPDNEELCHWPVITTTVDGEFLMGTSPNWTHTTNPTPGPLVIGSETNHFGPLQVISTGRQWGQYAQVNSVNEGVPTFGIADAVTPYSEWNSAWTSFDNQSALFNVSSIEIELLSFGDNPFTFSYQVDYDYAITSTTGQKQASANKIFTSKELPVMGPTDLSISKNPFVIGTSSLSDGRLIRLRYDIRTGYIARFKFNIKSLKGFHILNYDINYDTKDIPTLNQNVRLQRGQAR